MPRPVKRQDTKTFEVTVPLATYNALVRLATYTALGQTENAVAATILNQEVVRMQRAGEFGMQMPTSGLSAQATTPEVR